MASVHDGSLAAPHGEPSPPATPWTGNISLTERWSDISTDLRLPWQRFVMIMMKRYEYAVLDECWGAFQRKLSAHPRPLEREHVRDVSPVRWVVSKGRWRRNKSGQERA